MKSQEKLIAPTGELSSYLAGLIDGEGSFLISLNKSKSGFSPVLRVKITSTSRELLEEIRERVGVGYVYPYNLKTKEDFETFAWFIHDFKEVKLIVSAIEEKLILKRKELEAIKEVIKIIENKRKERGSRRGNFTKEEILKIAEIRDSIQRRRDKKYKDKEWFIDYFKNLERSKINVIE